MTQVNNLYFQKTQIKTQELYTNFFERIIHISSFVSDDDEVAR